MKSSQRLFLRTAAVALAAAIGSGVIAIAGVPAAMADSDLGCPGGATPNDATIATQLNSQLTNKMRGHMNAGNVACARVITQTVKSRGLSQHAATIAITTTIVETSIRNLDFGDGSSVGLFQQIDSWGSFAQRTDPVWSTNAFLGAMLSRFPDGSWATRPVGDVCQAVQRSKFPERYAPEAADGARIAAALWAGARRRVDRDVSGDGFADLMVIDGDGGLYYYPNNIKSANGVPFSIATWSSSEKTWGPVKAVSAGDISGDGFADLMVIGDDGRLYYYPNNIISANGVPFGSAAWASDATWASVKAISVGDVSGDGFADLMAIGGDGKLYYYPNNIRSNNGVPFGNAAWASDATWASVKAISAGDIGGDGFADLMAIGGDGKLYHYPNNIISANGVPFRNATWTSTSTAWADNRLAG